MDDIGVMTTAEILALQAQISTSGSPRIATHSYFYWQVSAEDMQQGEIELRKQDYEAVNHYIDSHQGAFPCVAMCLCNNNATLSRVHKEVNENSKVLEEFGIEGLTLERLKLMNTRYFEQGTSAKLWPTPLSLQSMRDACQIEPAPPTVKAMGQTLNETQQGQDASVVASTTKPAEKCSKCKARLYVAKNGEATHGSAFLDNLCN